MKSIGIYIYDNIELLDMAGPFEVFTVAQRLHVRQSDNPVDGLFNVFTIAEKEKKIISRGGIKIIPDYSIEYHPQADILILPGGIEDKEVDKKNVIEWLSSAAQRSDITASVCTGAFFLAQAGLLEGLEATTHWEDIDRLRKAFPAVSIKQDCRWVDEGHIITSAGISAGIDMSLYIVSRIAGQTHAKKTARQMEYSWSER